MTDEEIEELSVLLAEKHRLMNELLWDIANAKYNPATGGGTIPKGNPFSRPKEPTCES